MAIGWGKGLLGLTLALMTVTVSADGWSYADVDSWPEGCAADRQSPINIEPSEAVYEEELPGISLLFREHTDRDDEELEALAQVFLQSTLPPEEAPTTPGEVVEEIIEPEAAAQLGAEVPTTPAEVEEEMIEAEDAGQLGDEANPAEVEEEVIEPEAASQLGADAPTTPAAVEEELIEAEDAGQLGAEPTTPAEVEEEMIQAEDAGQLGEEETVDEAEEEAVEDLIIPEEADPLDSAPSTTPGDVEEEAIVPENAGELGNEEGPPAEESDDDLEDSIAGLIIPDDDTDAEEETESEDDLESTVEDLIIDGSEEPGPGEEEEEDIEEPIVPENAGTVEGEQEPDQGEPTSETDTAGGEEEEEEQEEEEEEEDDGDSESEDGDGDAPNLLGARAQARADVPLLLENTGHSLKVTLNDDIYLVGGGLGDMYKVAQLHFHWGNEDEQGSEHTLDGKSYPLEMHVVTYDSERYGSLSEAVDGFNSLAVLGVFFEISSKDNTELTPIMSAIDNVLDADTEYPLEGELEINNLLPTRTKEFYRYEGSLTTPPCYQSVVWTVFHNRQTISKDQLTKLRKVRSSPAGTEPPVPMSNNFRATQPINERVVYSSFIPGELVEPRNLNVISDPESGSSFVSSNTFTFVSLFIITMILNRFLY